MFIKRTLLLSWLCCLAFGFGTHALASNDAGSAPAPDFTLKSNNGKNIKLSELRGQVVMINFWASWCSPCLQEMPILNQLYKKYQSLGFALLGVNVEENNNDAIKWLKKVNINFPILFDTENSVSELYSVSIMPTTVIVDRGGNVRHIHHGYTPGVETSYQEQIRTLLKE